MPRHFPLHCYMGGGVIGNMIILRNKAFSNSPEFDDYAKRYLTRSQAASLRAEAKRDGKFPLEAYIDLEDEKRYLKNGSKPLHPNERLALESDDWSGKKDEEILENAKSRAKKEGQIIGGTMGATVGGSLGMLKGAVKTGKLNGKAAMVGAIAGGAVGGHYLGKRSSRDQEKYVGGLLEKRRKESRAAFKKKSTV